MRQSRPVALGLREASWRYVDRLKPSLRSNLLFQHVNSLFELSPYLDSDVSMYIKATLINSLRISYVAT